MEANFVFYYFWREMLTQAHAAYGGISWQPNKLHLVFKESEGLLQRYVGFTTEPSLFKRAAAFAVSFMDVENYLISGEFERHTLINEFKNCPKWSGATLAFEYIRYSLDGAEIKKNGGTVVLSSPIKVSEHSYIDIIHAFTHLNKNCAADFHLTSLLIEQLVYQDNAVSYPRNL